MDPITVQLVHRGGPLELLLTPLDGQGQPVAAGDVRWEQREETRGAGVLTGRGCLASVAPNQSIGAIDVKATFVGRGGTPDFDQFLEIRWSPEPPPEASPVIFGVRPYQPL